MYSREITHDWRQLCSQYFFPFLTEFPICQYPLYTKIVTNDLNLFFNILQINHTTLYYNWSNYKNKFFWLLYNFSMNANHYTIYHEYYLHKIREIYFKLKLKIFISAITGPSLHIVENKQHIWCAPVSIESKNDTSNRKRHTSNFARSRPWQ